MSDDALLAEYVRAEAFAAAHGDGPGRLRVLDWDLECPTPRSALAFLDYIAFRRMNDFHARHQRPLIIDCGANIGYTALWYKRRFPGARIVAFEPDPQFAPMLRGNLRRNGAGDVEVVEAAAWTTDGRAPWVTHGVDGSRLADKDDATPSTTSVATVDLCAYLDQDIDLLKIDVEGAEFELVPHLAPRLDRVRNVLVECHLVQGKYPGLSAVIETLSVAGFRLAVNSYGPWRDLTHRHVPEPLHAEQYLLVAAWRDDTDDIDRTPTLGPYTGIEAYRRSAETTAALQRLKPFEHHDIGGMLLALANETGRWQCSRLRGPFRRERGACWISTCPPIVSAGDTEARQESMTLLLEDERLLGPPHRVHDEIRTEGRGRYSHWGTQLYWSTSDNSDPNTNGRVYSLICAGRI